MTFKLYNKSEMKFTIINKMIVYMNTITRKSLNSN